MIHFPEPVVFFFWSRGRVFPIHRENLGQDIPFWGRFWGFIREKCLLFYYIPILGIGCEFFPKLFPKLGTIWEHFPSYSQYRGIIGTCKSQYTGVIETRKIHQRVIIGQIPLRGNFWDMENPLWGEIMWNSCPEIDFGRQFWYFFPNRLIHRLWIAKSFLWWASPLPFFFFAGVWENLFFHFLEAFVSLRWLVF